MRQDRNRLGDILEAIGKIRERCPGTIGDLMACRRPGLCQIDRIRGWD